MVELEELMETLLNVERVETEEMRRNWDCDQLTEIYNALKLEQDDFTQRSPLTREQTRRVKIRYVGEMLRIVYVMHLNSCDGWDRFGYKREELDAMEKSEKFNTWDWFQNREDIVDRMSHNPDEIYNIFRKDILPLADEYYSLIKGEELDDRLLRTYFKDKNKDRLESIKEGFKLFMDRDLFALTNLLESLCKTAEAEESRKQAEKLLKETFSDNNIRMLEERLSQADQEKEMLLERFIDLATTKDEARLADVKQLQEEHHKMMDEIIKSWDSKFNRLDEQEKELRDKEASLKKLLDKARDDAKATLNIEIRELQKTIKELGDKNNRYRLMIRKIGSEKDDLQERVNSLKRSMKRAESGESEVLVWREEARQYEIDYMTKFEAKMTDAREYPRTFTDTVNGLSIKVKNPENLRHYVNTEKKPKRNEHGAIPLNVSSIYQAVRTRLFDDDQMIIIEARGVSHLDAFQHLEIDDEPATLEEFLNITEPERIKAERIGYTKVLALLSPTGWDKRVMDFVCSSDLKKNLKTSRLVVFLVDMEEYTVHYNLADERTKVYIPIIKPEFDFTRELECERWIRDYIDSGKGGHHQKGISLPKVVKEGGFSWILVKKVFKKLKKTGDFNLRYLKNVGTVLEKKEKKKR